MSNNRFLEPDLPTQGERPRIVLEGDLIIDYSVFKKSPEEKRLLKDLKTQTKKNNAQR